MRRQGETEQVPVVSLREAEEVTLFWSLRG